MKKVFKIIAIIFIIMGLLVISYPMVSNYITIKQGLNAIVEYNSKIQDCSQETIDDEYQKIISYNNSFCESDYETVLNINGDGIMGYIEIPMIDIKLPIYHGTDNSVMSKGVGHIKNSSIPSREINTHTVLTSHTGFAKAKLFNDLDKLKIGEYFYIYILDESLKYRIIEINVVLPSDTEKIKIQENRNLATLITCTPYGKNTHRLLVTGELENEDEIREKNKIQEVKTSFKNEYVLYILIIVFLIVICGVIILNLS